MLRHLQAIIFEPTHPFLAEQDQTASFSYVYHQVMCWCSEISQFIIAWLLGHLVNGSFYSAVKHKTCEISLLEIIVQSQSPTTEHFSDVHNCIKF